MTKIPEGYYIKARIIKNKPIAHAPPHIREIWDYCLREANHKDVYYGGYVVKRGQLFRSYKDIKNDLAWFVGWRKQTYNENHMKGAMKYLRDNQMITTKKQLGGVLITVLNYSVYQDPKSYETTKETTNETTIEATNKQPSSTYNNKNVKNDKKKEYNNDFDFTDTIKDIIDIFNSTCGTKYTYRNKEVNEFIRGRISEGHTVEDFRTVILKKYNHWKDDPKNSQYITPNTFFRPSNFQKYLNQFLPTVETKKVFNG